MPSTHQSQLFKYNLIFWNIFGIWPRKIQGEYYKYYSLLYLFVTLLIYDVFLTLNLFYTPQKIELLIREVIFYFTEIVVMAKVLMILLMREKIIKALELLDCDHFNGSDDDTKEILNKSNKKYGKYYWMNFLFSNVAYSSQVFAPIILSSFKITDFKQELPICKYYFLSDELRQSHFLYWFIYQSIGMYGHMMYNVNIDSFIAGLLFMVLTQLQALKLKLNRLKLTTEEKKLSETSRDAVQILKLNHHLRHYNLILEFCLIVQEILSITMFVQFGVASTIICVVMCGLLLPSSTETLVFMVMYLFIMTVQIFLPGYLGTQLTYESHGLVFAAYSSEWIPRSEAFKRSLRIFMERGKTPIVITGLKIFPLSLVTFIAIMKTAYSFFTLIRNVQDKQQ